MEGAGRGDGGGGRLHDPGWLPKMTPRLGLQISFSNSKKHLKTTHKLEMRMMSWDPLRLGARGYGLVTLCFGVN